MPTSIRPGDVLADRYRLDDLLDESGGGRFWRAHDRSLDRARRRARHRAPTTSAPRPCSRPRGARRTRRSTAACCGSSTPTERGRALLRRQRVGLRAPPSTSCSPARARWRRAGPPGWSREVADAIAVAHAAGRRPRPAGPRERAHRPARARSGSSASRSTPRCTACRRAGVRPTSSTSAGLLYAALTGTWAGHLAVRWSRRARRGTAGCCARARCAPASRARSTPSATQVLNPDAGPGATPAAPTT